MEKAYVGNIVKFEYQGKPVVGIVYEPGFAPWGCRVQTLKAVTENNEYKVVRFKVKGIGTEKLSPATPEELKAFVDGLASTWDAIDNEIAVLEAQAKEIKQKIADLKAQKKVTSDITAEVPPFTPELIIEEETAEKGHVITGPEDEKKYSMGDDGELGEGEDEPED